MTRPAVLLLLLVSAVPTLAGLGAAFWFGLDAAALGRTLATPGIGLSITASVWSGVAATVLSLLLAHLAVALAGSGNWRRWLNNLSLPLLAMPHLAIGIGLALVLAPSGLLLRLLSPWATGLAEPPDWHIVQDPFSLSLIVGLVVKETAFLVMALFAALAQVPAATLQQQARVLGYGRLKAWLVAVAPLLQRQIRLPLAAVLVFGITNVELAIPLGPGLPPTFSVMLWRWFVDPDPAVHAQAYAGTLLLLAVTALTIAAAAGLARWWQRGFRRWAGSGARQTDERAVRGVLQCILSLFWMLGVLAIVAILLRSAAGIWRFPEVLPAGDALSAWRTMLPVAESVTVTTLQLGAATALLGIALVLPAAEQLRDAGAARRSVGSWLFLPLLVPQMTFLFGVQVLLVRLHIDGTFAAVLWSHLVFALPYIWGLLATARAAIDPRYLQAARTLGAPPHRAWATVTAPLMARSTLIAAALAFSVSIALYLPTLFAGAGRVATAATAAAAAAASGTLRLAAVHAILLALAPFTAFAAAYCVGALLYCNRLGVPK